MSKKIDSLNISDDSKGIISCQDDDPADLGILQEIGNIGAGHAATSLSTVLQQDVSIDLPRVCSVPTHLVAKYYEKGDAPTTAVLMQLQREYECDILLMFDQIEAKKIAALMTMAPSVEELDDLMEESAIQELANIVIGSFLTAISDFTNVTLIPTPPLRVVDSFNSILDNLLVKQSMIAERALVFDACFKRQGTDAKSILIIFPSASLKAILLEKSKEMMGIASDIEIQPNLTMQVDAVQVQTVQHNTL
ncbi:MAG: chemotaxis protein CheC [Candidatus Bathyarchaeia archaeon]|jgi:chemotaxis protein CheC